MIKNNAIHTIGASIFLILISIILPLLSHANYDKLPSRDTISAMAVYNKLTFNVPTPSSPDQANYNITDPDAISEFFDGLIERKSSIISNLKSINIGRVYLKTNDNKFFILKVFDDWNHLYVYSAGSSKNIYYEISPETKTFLLTNSHSE